MAGIITQPDKINGDWADVHSKRWTKLLKINMTTANVCWRHINGAVQTKEIPKHGFHYDDTQPANEQNITSGNVVLGSRYESTTHKSVY